MNTAEQPVHICLTKNAVPSFKNAKAARAFLRANGYSVTQFTTKWAKVDPHLVSYPWAAPSEIKGTTQFKALVKAAVKYSQTHQ